MPGNPYGQGRGAGPGSSFARSATGTRRRSRSSGASCGLVRPWNDPLRDIESARGTASSDIFVAVSGEGSGRIAGSVMAGYTPRSR